ncbi:FadR/GntR family transcriptional regulator [Marinovum algicola]|uniref:FadR/GntR family transcriptional regulator n=1 Tax=Marinovum algicola TaxID=42444 RepID=UPI0024BB8B5E|nr:GntR family transcriptional regulator [Marinovum algicola]
MRMTKQDALGRLQRLIDRAAPASGDRLPTERRMAETLGCSRATLRAALAELESRGQIWRRVGQGTFRGRAPIGQPLRDAILIEATTSLDLMDARVLLEPQVAAAAADAGASRPTSRICATGSPPGAGRAITRPANAQTTPFTRRLPK